MVWCAKSVLQAVCILRLLRVSNLCEHHTEVVFRLKVMVGGSEHKVVLDKRESRVYCVEVDCGLNFLSVHVCHEQGAALVLIGVAANKCFVTGLPVKVKDSCPWLSDRAKLSELI